MSQYLFTVNNDSEGWTRIQEFRKCLKNSGFATKLYGRHKNRKQLAIDLCSPKDGENVPIRDVEFVHNTLRRGVPPRYAQTIRVYMYRKHVES